MQQDPGLLSIDLHFYRSAYPDLQGLDDQGLMQHYQRHGEAEGRIASSFATREGFFSILQPSDDILEIGPFTNPLVCGPRVRYFDVMDKPALIARALEHKRSIELARDIDYVSPSGDLSIITDARFDVVLSSHCIEHQPDLVRHLRQVGDILKPGGYYLLIVPDKRFCFDHYIAESSLADVLCAHHEQRRVHSLASVLEHKLLTTHNDPMRHWYGDHGETAVARDPQALERAMEEYRAAQGAYIDVHAWQFTPRSLRQIVGQLHQAGLVQLQVEHAFGTPVNALEFCAVLRKPA